VTNAQADTDPTQLRLSLDAKTSVLLGNFSRGGRSRVSVQAADHDFQADARVTPFGILLPDTGETFLYLTTSRVTSDFIVDCLVDCWQQLRQRFPQVGTLVLNLDNGPENQSRRTQFMQRLSQWADDSGLTIELAYYPPYHSKYNPIERVWGVLEQHWNGSLLDSLDTVVRFAQSMTFRGIQPIVQLWDRAYSTGVKLTQSQMAALETRFQRYKPLAKWSVRIAPLPC